MSIIHRDPTDYETNKVLIMLLSYYTNKNIAHPGKFNGEIRLLMDILHPNSCDN